LTLRLLVGMLKMERRDNMNMEGKRNYIPTAPLQKHVFVYHCHVSQHEAVAVKGGMLRRRLARRVRAKEHRECTAVAFAGRRRNSGDFKLSRVRQLVTAVRKLSGTFSTIQQSDETCRHSNSHGNQGINFIGFTLPFCKRNRIKACTGSLTSLQHAYSMYMSRSLFATGAVLEAE